MNWKIYKACLGGRRRRLSKLAGTEAGQAVGSTTQATSCVPPHLVTLSTKCIINDIRVSTVLVLRSFLQILGGSF